MSDKLESGNIFEWSSLAAERQLEIDRLKRERDEAYERAAQIVDAYSTPADVGKVFEVASWNVVSEAIRALKDKP